MYNKNSLSIQKLCKFKAEFSLELFATPFNKRHLKILKRVIKSFLISIKIDEIHCHVIQVWDAAITNLH